MIRELQPRSLLVTAFFIAVLLIDLWHHEMWADELHAWGLTVSSTSVVDLFHNLHYEGHPGLWHLLLYGPSRVTDAPTAVKLVHGAIAILVCLMIGLISPFRLIEKVLLLLNYFVVFEYTVISRNYGIGLLLALAYAWLRVKAPHRALLAAVILGALANTNIFALFLSGFLFAEYLWSIVLARCPPAPAMLARGLGACAIYLVLLILAVATFYPAPDISRVAIRPLDAVHIFDPTHFGTTLLQFMVAPFLAIDFSFPLSFASPGIYYSPLRIAVATVLLVPIGTAVWLTFHRDARLLAVLTATVICSVVFSHSVYDGEIRHFGITFVAFLCCLWLVRSRLPARSLPILFLLGLGAISGAVSLAGQWMRPFSDIGPAARWIVDHNLRDAGLIGGQLDVVAGGVGIMLQRPVYFLYCGCVSRYVRLTNERDDFSVEQTPERLPRAAEALFPRPLILIVRVPLTTDQLAAAGARGVTLRLVRARGRAERDSVTLYAIETK